MDLTLSASACAKLSAANVHMHATVDQLRKVLVVNVTIGMTGNNKWVHDRSLCFSYFYDCGAVGEFLLSVHEFCPTLTLSELLTVTMYSEWDELLRITPPEDSLSLYAALNEAGVEVWQ